MHLRSRQNKWAPETYDRVLSTIDAPTGHRKDLEHRMVTFLDKSGEPVGYVLSTHGWMTVEIQDGKVLWRRHDRLQFQDYIINLLGLEESGSD